MGWVVNAVQCRPVSSFMAIQESVSVCTALYFIGCTQVFFILFDVLYFNSSFFAKYLY